MLQFVTRKFRSTVALLLIAVIVLLPMIGQQSALLSKLGSINQLVTLQKTSPCHQQKSARSGASRLCESANSLQFYAIVSDVFTFNLTATGKISFLFILGLLAASHNRRIFKPPKLQYCA